MTQSLSLTNRACKTIARNVWHDQAAIDFVDFGHDQISTYINGIYKPEHDNPPTQSCMQYVDMKEARSMFGQWLSALKERGINMVVIRRPPGVMNIEPWHRFVIWRAAFFKSREEYISSDLYRAKQLHEQGKAK